MNDFAPLNGENASAETKIASRQDSLDLELVRYGRLLLLG
jgi:hypothetical protein